MTLYELTGEYMELLQMAEDPEIDPQLIADTMEGVAGEIEEKAEGYGKIIRTLEAEAEAIKAEEARIAARRKGLEDKAQRIKKTLEASMIETGKKKFKTTLFSFNVQKNAPSLDLIEGQKIPDEFYIPQEPKLDRKAALDYIKANGDQVWGRKIQTESLRIR